MEIEDRKTLDYREREIISMLKNQKIGDILDIGSSKNSIFAEGERIKTVDIKDADIIQDLNKNQTLRFKDRTFDMIILSQILEHLVNVEKIVQESKRVSRRYILIGLPNELKLDNRIRYLFGRVKKWEEQNSDDGYYPYGHKHFFTIKRMNLFIRRFFGKYEKRRYVYGVSGGRFIPDFLKKFLANEFPSLFAGEAYYLVNVLKEN